jgi:pyrroloquinoline quinone biosynthesis protein B
MLVKILGAAAGGGFPQWNCNCLGCQSARSGRSQALTQSAIAVRASNEPWLLVNASPDVRQQLERLRAEGLGLVANILLTDAEIDHTTGLILLRESANPLRVYSLPSVKRALNEGYSLFSTLQNYCGLDWFPLEFGHNLTLAGLEIEIFPLSYKPPKYMQPSEFDRVWGVGLTFRDRATGGVLTYAPGLAKIDDAISARFESSHCILVDGTFWRNDELPALGRGSRTAYQMGHLPLSGTDGSLSQLAKLSTSRKILVHINNTNPILISHSPERKAVEATGVEVGYDGLAIEL